MAASTRDDDEVITGINVTPLVDIALVLLVVFLVTAKVLVSPALPMTLPKATQTSDVDAKLAIELGADGRVLVGGDAVASDAEVVAKARAAKARDPEVQAILRADGSVPHARVIRAIDLLKEAGVSRIAFATAAPGLGGAAPLVGGAAR